MALNIKCGETDRLARELAALTGETITQAVTRALAERLGQERRDRNRVAAAARAARLDELFDRMQSYPVLDPRPVDEILGYNDIGTFD